MIPYSIYLFVSDLGLIITNHFYLTEPWPNGLCLEGLLWRIKSNCTHARYGWHRCSNQQVAYYWINSLFFSVIRKPWYALWQMMTLQISFRFSIGMQLLLKEIPTSSVSSSTFKAVLQSIANWKHLQCDKIFPAC